MHALHVACMTFCKSSSHARYKILPVRMLLSKSHARFRNLDLACPSYYTIAATACMHGHTFIVAMETTYSYCTLNNYISCTSGDFTTEGKHGPLLNPLYTERLKSLACDTGSGILIKVHYTRTVRSTAIFISLRPLISKVVMVFNLW